MRVPIVFVDANVFYSKTLRDWLFLLREGTSGVMFTVASSNDVVAETLYRIRRNDPTGPGHLTSNVKETIEASLDELVRDFPEGIAFPGNDADDTHVHAASITCGAAYLVTDDPGFHEISDELPYEVHSADSFFQLIAENVPQVLDEVIRKQVTYWQSRNSDRTLSEALASAGCPIFAEIVHRHLRASSAGATTAGIAASVNPLAVEDLTVTQP